MTVIVSEWILGQIFFFAKVHFPSLLFRACASVHEPKLLSPIQQREREGPEKQPLCTDSQRSYLANSQILPPMRGDGGISAAVAVLAVAAMRAPASRTAQTHAATRRFTKGTLVNNAPIKASDESTSPPVTEILAEDRATP